MGDLWENSCWIGKSQKLGFRELRKIRQNFKGIWEQSQMKGIECFCFVLKGEGPKYVGRKRAFPGKDKTRGGREEISLWGQWDGLALEEKIFSLETEAKNGKMVAEWFVGGEVRLHEGAHALGLILSGKVESSHLLKEERQRVRKSIKKGQNRNWRNKIAC